MMIEHFISNLVLGMQYCQSRVYTTYLPSERRVVEFSPNPIIWWHIYSTVQPSHYRTPSFYNEEPRPRSLCTNDKYSVYPY